MNDKEIILMIEVQGFLHHYRHEFPGKDSTQAKRYIKRMDNILKKYVRITCKPLPSPSQSSD